MMEGIRWINVPRIVPIKNPIKENVGLEQARDLNEELARIKIISAR